MNTLVLEDLLDVYKNLIKNSPDGKVSIGVEIEHRALTRGFKVEGERIDDRLVRLASKMGWLRRLPVSLEGNDPHFRAGHALLKEANQLLREAHKNFVDLMRDLKGHIEAPEDEGAEEETENEEEVE